MVWIGDQQYLKATVWFGVGRPISDAAPFIYRQVFGFYVLPQFGY